MAIERIDLDECLGCGKCVRACGCDVIRMDEETGKAKILYREDCMVCGFCADDCPVNAVILTPERLHSHPVAFY